MRAGHLASVLKSKRCGESPYSWWGFRWNSQIKGRQEHEEYSQMYAKGRVILFPQGALAFLLIRAD